MVTADLRELVWHDDGHGIYLRIEKDKITVNPAPCPHSRSEESACYHRGVSGCMVEYFVQMYGLEVNEGICPPSEEMEVAWAFHGDLYDIDASQVWIIPKADEDFAAWLVAERQKVENSESDNS